MGVWRQAILKRFNTVKKLLRIKCRAILVSMGSIVKYDICHIGCNRACIRRLVLASQTWLPNFQQVSAEFLLDRHRLLRLRKACKAVQGPA